MLDILSKIDKKSEASKLVQSHAHLSEQVLCADNGCEDDGVGCSGNSMHVISHSVIVDLCHSQTAVAACSSEQHRLSPRLRVVVANTLNN